MSSTTTGPTGGAPARAVRVATGDRAGLLRLWLPAGALLALAAIVVAVSALGASGYEAIALSYPGSATAMTAALLRGVAVLAAVWTVGQLAWVVLVRPRAGAKRSAVAARELGGARWGALVQLLAALALVPVDAADASGQPVARLLEPGAFAYYLEASYRPGAWLVVAVLAAAVLALTVVASSWVALAAALALALAAVLPPVVSGQLLTGPGHDFAGDAGILGAPAMALLVGVLAARVAATLAGRAPGPLGRRRFGLVAVIAFAVAALSLLVIAPFQLAGTGVLTSPTGVLHLVRFALLGAVAALLALALRADRAGRPASTLVGGAAAAGLVAVGVDVAMTRIPPPNYFVLTTISETFLGYDVSAPPTLASLLSIWRPDLLFLTLTVAGAGLYAAGVVVLRRRGDAWPVGRTVAWMLGWGVIAVTTSSSVGFYAGAAFSFHMVLHMSLNMLGPLLLVLGGPVTLALRALPAHPPAQPAGPHEWLTQALHSRLARLVFNPMLVFVVFVGSFYALYFTPLFGEAMRFHWAHQLMNLHFLAVGYLFYGLIVGVDRPPVALPHIGKLGLVLAAMPFHAFFGVIVMTSGTVFAEQYYSYLDVPWIPDLAADQYVGGGIAWAAGELPLVLVVVALVTQWARQDRRSAQRADRHADTGRDDSFDAYNEMLQRLSARGAGPDRSGS